MEVPRLSLRDLAAELIAGRKCGFHPHRGLSRGRGAVLDVIANSWDTAAEIELDRAALRLDRTVLRRPPIRASPRPTRARARSPTLVHRVREGRLLRTSKPRASIRSSIARPPRENRSISTASAPGIFGTKARPWSNSARVRSTSNFINSAQAGVNRSAFRSDWG